jgi:carbon monoxide dehydrogenase subunit G
VTAVTASVVVAADQQAVWAALTDWTAQGSWMPMTTVVVDGGDGALGTRLIARTGLGRLAVADPMQVDVWEPPHRCEVEHLGSVLRGRGIFTVEALGAERSRLTLTEELDGALAKAGRPIGALTLHVALRRFARQVERPR